MSHEVMPSLERAHRTFLPELEWGEISEAGAYVERETGNLYRVPAEVLIKGTPIVVRETRAGSSMVQISKNPFVITEQARLSCAQHNIAPNF